MPQQDVQDVESVSEKDAIAVKSGWKDEQSRVLPHKKLMVVFPVLATIQFTSYLDQTTISTAVPSIGYDLGLGPSIPWIAASFLIASTSVQLINGRLSDIFGRKELLLVSLGLLGLGNLISGFSRNGPMLFVFRAVSGLGGGAINALVMITASDITTLQQRGKYNGFIGAAVALGNGIGPIIGGALTDRAGWRWSLWYAVPWIAFVAALAACVLPASRVTGSGLSKLKMIDWLGVVVNVAAVVVLLVPLSEGGATFPWNGTLVISMLTIGSLLVVVFVLVEWKVAKLPMMPLRLFTSDASANILLLQSLLFGFVFWGNLYYVPVYLQTVRGYDAVTAGALVIPLVAPQGIGSILGGRLISATGRYNLVIVPAQALWAVGAALQAVYARSTPLWAVCLILFLQGIGVGGAFQPSLVALLAHSRKADRAVVNSLRNFLRTVGGAAGLTVSAAIINNVLTSRLASTIPQNDITQLAASAYGLQRLGLNERQKEAVLDAYMTGLHYVFIVYAPLIGVCFLMALFVKDRGVAEKDATPAERAGATLRSEPAKEDSDETAASTANTTAATHDIDQREKDDNTGKRAHEE